MAVEREGELVAADVEGPDRNRAPAHALDQLRQRLVLFVLAGQGVAIHVEEFGAQQADPLGPGPESRFELDRLDVEP